ncbi:insulinase family protein [Pedobacter sp. NJ-S-72]
MNESIFPQQELDIFKQNQQQSLKVSLQKNDFIARKNFAHAIFGTSTYGSDINEEDYQKIERADLIAYFSAAYKPENCTIFVAGKFEQAEFDLLNANFGKGWNNQAVSTVNQFALTGL